MNKPAAGPGIDERFDAIKEKIGHLAGLLAGHFGSCPGAAVDDREEIAALADRLQQPALGRPAAVDCFEDIEERVDAFEALLQRHLVACPGM